MKRLFKYTSVFSILTFMLTVFIGQQAYAGRKNAARIKKTSEDMYVQFDGNRIATYMSNNGKIVDNDPTGQSGMEWPRGSTNTIDYASGLWIIGIARTDTSREIRTACAEYASEFKPGSILANGQPDDPGDAKYKIYKITSDDANALLDDKADTNPSDDWAAWPFDQGAPVLKAKNGSDSLFNGQKLPGLIGDQTCFFVMNDADTTEHSNLFATLPMGLEVQTTVFGFNRKDALGDMMFVKWVIINKSQNNYDSVFVAVWDDPDMGDGADDLVCNDTTLSLGIDYNGNPADAQYGITPPAIGFDFFQGPKVGDSYLPMSSFVYYWNGAPDPYGDPEDAGQAFNFIRGKLSDGSSYINPITHLESKYVFSGDPITAQGWIDSSPGDRRFLMSSGPFNMAPGDVQVVVGAKIIAQGSTNLSSIGAVKYYDQFAQNAFQYDFDLVNPPTPEVTAEGYDKTVTLTWDVKAANEKVENYNYLDYPFEGYNVYQGESEQGPWKLLKTFDVVNDKAVVYEDVYDPSVGWLVNKPTAFGANSGMERSITLDFDYIKGLPLRNYSTYYYAVTSYVVNLDKVPAIIESGVKAKAVVPGTFLDVEETPQVADELRFDRISGVSDSKIVGVVVDPRAMVNATYDIEVRTDPARAGETEPLPAEFWTLKKNGTVLDQQLTLFSGEANSPIYDGIQFKVNALFGGAPTSFSEILAMPSGRTEFQDILEWDPSHNFYDIRSYMIFGVANDWAANPDNWGYGTTDRALLTQDVELRFTGEYEANGCTVKPGTGSIATMTGARLYDIAESPMNPNPGSSAPFTVRIPFEVWNVETNQQISIALFDRFQTLHDSLDGKPVFYAFNPRNRMYTYFINDPYTESVVDSNKATWTTAFFKTQWKKGDVIKFVYSSTLTGASETFQLVNHTLEQSAELAKVNLKKINVVPNPYFGFNPAERNPAERVLRFTHLPAQGAVIRIFDLAGNLVRRIDDQTRSSQGTSGTPYAEWDLRNQSDIPVASGLYLAHVEIEGVGSVVLKVALINRDERLLYY